MDLEDIETELFGLISESAVLEWDEFKVVFGTDSNGVHSSFKFNSRVGDGVWNNPTGIKPFKILRMLNNFKSKNRTYEGHDWKCIEFIFGKSGVKSRQFGIKDPGFYENN